jgi:DNA invertase Pin-like site-specific DNA recombinase
MRAAYLRVSTREQNLHGQRDALSKLGVDRFFEEKRSGLDDARPVLAECLRFLREGDTLYVTRADRLARSTEHLLRVIRELKAKDVQVVFTEQPELSTDTATGELMLTILAGIAKFETRLRAERQADGIKAAQARGVKFGRKSKLTPDVVQVVKRLRTEGLSVPQIVHHVGLKRSTVYKALSAG